MLLGSTSAKAVCRTLMKLSPERFNQTQVSFVDDLSIVNGRMDFDSTVERSGRKCCNLFVENFQVSFDRFQIQILKEEQKINVMKNGRFQKNLFFLYHNFEEKKEWMLWHPNFFHLAMKRNNVFNHRNFLICAKGSSINDVTQFLMIFDATLSQCYAF